jgi:hypothetical protein
MGSTIGPPLSGRRNDGLRRTNQDECRVLDLRSCRSTRYLISWALENAGRCRDPIQGLIPDIAPEYDGKDQDEARWGP